MKRVSIFNDVLGPVMRGPSSSHTAGSFHIARIVRDLFGGQPSRARLTFDTGGSYARVFREQGVDRAFAVGLLGWPLTDARFQRVLELAPSEGLDIGFDVQPLARADHPNTVAIEMSDDGGGTLSALARSIGGGSVEILAVDDCEVHLTGEMYEVLVEVAAAREECERVLVGDGQAAGEVRRFTCRGVTLLHATRLAPLGEEARTALRRLRCDRVREARPNGFVKRGPGLFDSAATMLALSRVAVPRTSDDGERHEPAGLRFDDAQSRRPGNETSFRRGTSRLQPGSNASLGRVALAHEASVLGISETEALDEMLRRLDVMVAAVAEGLSTPSGPGATMQLLEPSARAVLDAEAAGRVAIGGLHTRAAARALAAMHVNSRMGIVCAAPTGGSAGVLPAVVVTLLEEGKPWSRDRDRGTADAVSRVTVAQDFSPAASRQAAALALFAAGAIGIVVASRATFAAEVAGCQVEIGAAGAMAAAAVVEYGGGSAAQAAEAAAIAFQNTMGSVCDLVQGVVEIPCHTRNAAAASSAFVCADLVMGGYRNPIPLDETVDAVYAVGRMLPSELRCTARGGLAVTPSALALRRRTP